jgi:hypothetical protein
MVKGLETSTKLVLKVDELSLLALTFLVGFLQFAKFSFGLLPIFVIVPHGVHVALREREPAFEDAPDYAVILLVERDFEIVQNVPKFSPVFIVEAPNLEHHLKALAHFFHRNHLLFKETYSELTELFAQILVLEILKSSLIKGHDVLLGLFRIFIVDRLLIFNPFKPHVLWQAVYLQKSIPAYPKVL